MKMSKLLMLKGLPASGKSTYAKELVDKGWIRVNKDDLRAMLNNSKWSSSNEVMILWVRDSIISEALQQGKSVVVDDTNFAPIHYNKLSSLAASFGASFDIKFFDTPLEVCIERDLKRPVSVGKDVIIRMYNQYLRPSVEDYIYDEDAKPAIMVDIDGTLAHMVNRGPFEWSKVKEDEVDYSVREVTQTYAMCGDKIIIMSGRDEICREDTEEWLKMHNIYYDYLYMRQQGDKRKDTVVKQELFDNNVRGKFRIKFVLDDRWSVCEMWLLNGLKVLNCSGLDRGEF